MDLRWYLLTKETLKENECPMTALYDTLKRDQITAKYAE